MFKIDPLLKHVLEVAGIDIAELFARLPDGSNQGISDMPQIAKLGIDRLNIQRDGDTLQLTSLNYYDNVSCIEILTIYVTDKGVAAPDFRGSRHKYDIVFGCSIGRNLDLDAKVMAGCNSTKDEITAAYLGKTLSAVRTLPAFIPDLLIENVYACGFIGIDTDFAFVTLDADNDATALGQAA